MPDTPTKATSNQSFSKASTAAGAADRHLGSPHTAARHVDLLRTICERRGDAQRIGEKVQTGFGAKELGQQKRGRSDIERHGPGSVDEPQRRRRNPVLGGPVTTEPRIEARFVPGRWRSPEARRRRHACASKARPARDRAGRAGSSFRTPTAGWRSRPPAPSRSAGPHRECSPGGHAPEGGTAGLPRQPARVVLFREVRLAQGHQAVRNVGFGLPCKCPVRASCNKARHRRSRTCEKFDFLRICSNRTPVQSPS